MSTCSRRQVGAVVVQGREVIGNGFNGVAAGKQHCVDGGCPRGQLSYSEVQAGADYNVFPCYAIHAEHNAILQAGLERCMGATIFVTDQPCQQCTNLIEHAKIARVVIMGHGRNDDGDSDGSAGTTEPDNWDHSDDSGGDDDE